MLANYIKLNWRGAWSSESTYNYNDAVSYLGSSYVALRATTEQPGESAADWKLIAKKGEDGRGIVSFELIDTQEKTKTYRMLFTDATYVDIAIIDGNDGVDGLTPYIGMNGNWWIGDVDQNIKAEGVDGISPTIGLNGNWYLGSVDTGVKAQGQDGYTPIKDVDYFDGYTPVKDVDYFDGITPTIGLNKHWFIGAIDTGIVAEGKDGEDGVTPIITIGENENWYINGVDSGKPSRGKNGKSAYEIYLAGGGTLSEAEFNESITNIPSHIEDATKHIDTTTAEFSGTIDETNDKFTIWDNSLLKWIRFSFTNLKSYLKTYFDGIYSATGHNHAGTYEPANSNIQNHIGNSDIHVTTTDKSNWNGKQAALGFTPENVSNKKTTLTDNSDTYYPSQKAVKIAVDAKQDTLVSGTNIKTINNESILGSGNLVVTGSGEVNTASNLGTGSGIYSTKVGSDLRFKSLKAGTNVTLSSDANEITINASGGGGGTSLWTAIVGTRASNTTITVAGDQTAIFKKGMIVRWLESSVIKWGMVSIPSTYSNPNTTITIIGCICSSIDTDSFKYSTIIGAEQFIERFALAGTIGAAGTNVMRAYYATEPMYVFGADIQAGTAGTTNSTTVDINKNGTTMFSVKPALATTIAASTTPFTADTATSLSLNDKVTIDIDSPVQTTPAVDLYIQLYVVPQRYFTLT
jgi:hypothetical protein